mmetsp:Transcript_21534/g.63090  ORF Transcript_21534/g.63090 Transcript_21534/m.63090 type:complete len:208 (-) Transcript_21534:716-1339(-)
MSHCRSDRRRRKLRPRPRIVGHVVVHLLLLRRRQPLPRGRRRCSIPPLHRRRRGGGVPSRNRRIRIVRRRTYAVPRDEDSEGGRGRDSSRSGRRRGRCGRRGCEDEEGVRLHRRGGEGRHEDRGRGGERRGDDFSGARSRTIGGTIFRHALHIRIDLRGGRSVGSVGRQSGGIRARRTNQGCGSGVTPRGRIDRRRTYSAPRISVQP